MTDQERAAMQQALAALEQSETTVPYEGFGMARRDAERKHQAAIVALRAALAQQAEPVKPVAWMYDCGGGGRMYAEVLDGVPGWVPLYTAPPQRKPLTDEEIRLLARDTFLEAENIWNEDTREDLTEFTRAVERAHGIPKP